ncbi:hypothetical protein [Streptomyces sp. NBRC 110611]|nr:hypothetical protein [Streptomyces sp. NBRC 110611]
MNAAEVVNALLVQRVGARSGDVTDETPLRRLVTAVDGPVPA